jgi:hypothetical protein
LLSWAEQLKKSAEAEEEKKEWSNQVWTRYYVKYFK